MNTTVKNTALESRLFSAGEAGFTALAVDVFLFQYHSNPVYRQYCELLHTDIDKIDTIEKIPFLPISFFKTHAVTTTDFEPEAIFESSGTTQTINSKHLVRDVSLYEKSFTKAFDIFYDNASDWCILALLPSYLERKNSSLVMMADRLIKQSGHPQGGFYLDGFDKLKTTLQQLEQQQQKTLLIGVTFALLDFSEQCPMPLKHTTIMETGGMKGRRKEILRQEVHGILCNKFQLPTIHSEYGMTELLSQAYSKGNGIFNCPPWMRVLLREEDDPLSVRSSFKNKTISGAVNVIDLANLYSCSFIATDDAGKLYADGSFEILGRLDNSDIRGCSLLTI